MVAVIVKISEYVVVIYNFQTEIADRVNISQETLFYSSINILTLRGSLAIQHKEFIIYYFITLDSISTATTITLYCRIAYASNIFT